MQLVREVVSVEPVRRTGCRRAMVGPRLEAYVSPYRNRTGWALGTLALGTLALGTLALGTWRKREQRIRFTELPELPELPEPEIPT